MKKEYINPEMLVVKMETTAGVLTESMGMNGTGGIPGQSLAPHYYFSDEDEDEFDEEEEYTHSGRRKRY